MYQFFVDQEQIRDQEITIKGSDVNHIRNVLRMKPGDEIAVSNGRDAKEYRCAIEAFTEDAVLCTLRFIKEDGQELPSRIYLFQGLPKADKMEFIIQKAVELGVFEIIPMETKRAVVKLDEKKVLKKIQRWQAIAESAAKQSKRRVIPTVQTPMTMKEAVTYVSGLDVCFIPYELAEGMRKTKQAIGELSPGQTIAVFIGPEGGFEEDEVQLAAEHGIMPITLGKRILRTETAGLTLLSWIMYQLENDS